MLSFCHLANFNVVDGEATVWQPSDGYQTEEAKSAVARDQDPTVARRRLRTELKRARDTAGFKQADVAKAMEWSTSKVIRIESGDVKITTNDLKALLEHYKIHEKSRVNALLEAARAARATSFYDQYAGDLKQGFRDYLAYEASAAVIRQWEPILISGLLQTEEYARRVLEDTFGVSDQDADKLWSVRQHRQELHDREDPPEMRFVIDESAVRRTIGPDGATMRKQVERLLEFAALDHVTIQILPFSAGATPGMGGSFVLLEFSEPDLDDLVHLESVDEITIRDDATRLGEYTDRFEKIEKAALTPKDSVRFLEELAGGGTAGGETGSKGAG